ncbi:O-antigen ligase [Humibacter sp. RRB41]|uniref:O-antigen ligase family protein n=1 Tax=Humibacter sp. RRB41 TaxID=2919946 RepID=UPI001FA98148|nr:O-antigen ligase family protein [Humibacter sp. RRB41]
MSAPSLVAVITFAVVVGVGLGVLSVSSSLLALVVGVVVLLAGVAARDYTIIPVLAVPATLVLTRVGGAFSVSDVVLALASVVSLLALRGRGASILRPLIWAGVFYLATAIPTQILNPYSANGIEWMHEVVLVLGSLVVGFVIGRADRARVALTLYVLGCIGIGVVAIYVSLTTFLHTREFQPVYLTDLNKNTIGGMLGAAAVIAFARPIWLRWSRGWSWLAVIVCSLGVVAAQSRQGLVGEIVGILIVSIRARPQTGRRVRIVWLAAIPGVAWVVSELTAQLESSNQFNSAHQRVDWYSQAFQIWEKSPLFGVGMRWWYTDRFAGQFQSFQPPNAEMEVLTTVGIFGLIGFLTLFAVAGWYLWRMDPVYGTVGFAVVAMRFTQAQFDLYWVAGQASLLWIVAGICYGVQALDDDRRARGLPLSWQQPFRNHERHSLRVVAIQRTATRPRAVVHPVPFGGSSTPPPRG